MDHKTLKQKLFDLYDGALTGADRQDAEIHLAQCAECREIYAGWQKTARALFRVPEPAVSDAFVHRVLDRLPVSSPRRRTAPWMIQLEWLVPAMGLAALMLAVLGPVEQAVSVDALLFGDEQERTSTRLMLAGETPSSDEVLGLVMEGSP